MVKKRVVEALGDESRPVAYVCGLLSMLYGSALIFHLGGITHGLLYVTLSSWFNPTLIGVFFLAIGIIYIIALIIKLQLLIDISSFALCCLWIYISFAYIFGGNWFYAITVGGFNSYITGHTTNALKRQSSNER